MKYNLLFVLGFVLAYLLGSFIAWDFNAGNWSIFERILWSGLGILIGWVFSESNKPENK